MAVIDVAGFVADLKDHAIDHGFHVHDERHFVETYSLRQTWEVDLHPEEACSGPLDLHLALEVDPGRCWRSRTRSAGCDDPDDDPPDGFTFPLHLHLDAAAAARPARPAGAGHRAGRHRRHRAAGRGVGHRLVPVGHRRPRAQPADRRPRRGLAGPGVPGRGAVLCDTLDRCRAVSLYLLEQAPRGWATTSCEPDGEERTDEACASS